MNENVKKIYLLGIGGIAMGTLAAMLKQEGFEVIGSDQQLYPPMSTQLEKNGIGTINGYSATNISRHKPDLVIIGNVIRRENPEAQAVLQNGTPYLSMPQAIARFFIKERKSLVIAGTHGKSTTSSLLGWILTQAGYDPCVFIGAVVNNWQTSHRTGKGPYMVIEGDEYDTAFFDKGPKFLHYRPHIGVITSIEYDHADIFPDLRSIQEAFGKFAGLIPPEGYLVVNADNEHCIECLKHCRSKTMTYGKNPDADWKLIGLDYSSGQVRIHYFNPLTRQPGTLVSRLPGLHNASNTLAALAVASLTGLTETQVQAGVLSFGGVMRRQQVMGKPRDILVIDDFAHHPTAVRETLQALKLFHPNRRIIAAFEPRTNSSRRSVFQNAYADAFEGAAIVCIKQPSGMELIPPEERLDTTRLVEDLTKRGHLAFLFEDTEDLLAFLVRKSAPGDMVVSMSNGAFDDLPRKLVKNLE